MNKILKLNSYSQYDELGEEDYMVYEVEHDDGHKEYVSRDVFRRLKAIEIIKKKGVNLHILKMCDSVEEYNKLCNIALPLTQEEYELLKEVLLCQKK